jgi:hypothetical protein
VGGLGRGDYVVNEQKSAGNRLRRERGRDVVPAPSKGQIALRLGVADSFQAIHDRDSPNTAELPRHDRCLVVATLSAARTAERHGHDTLGVTSELVRELVRCEKLARRQRKVFTATELAGENDLDQGATVDIRRSRMIEGWRPCCAVRTQRPRSWQVAAHASASEVGLEDLEAGITQAVTWPRGQVSLTTHTARREECYEHRLEGTRERHCGGSARYVRCWLSRKAM